MEYLQGCKQNINLNFLYVIGFWTNSYKNMEKLNAKERRERGGGRKKREGGREEELESERKGW